MDDGTTRRELPLYSSEALELLSETWLKVEWNLDHWQSLSWLGRPIWQLPEDLLRLQEVVVDLRPDVIVETGVARGGSAIFFASLCRLLGQGRVVSIDVHIPAEVRDAITAHPVGSHVTLIEGDSTSAAIRESVRSTLRPEDRVLVFLDSDHGRAHVLAELACWAPLVTPGSYAIACDGVMRVLADTPNGRPEWTEDNPATAAREFASANPDFVLAPPSPRFAPDRAIRALTYWPDAWLRRR